MKNWLRHRVARHMLFWVAVMGFFFLMQLPAHLLAGANVHVLVMFTDQLPLSMLATYSLLYGLLPLLLIRRRAALFLSGLGVWLFVCWLLTVLLRVFGLLAMAGRFAGAPKQALQWTDYLTLPYTFFTVLVTAGVACAIKVSDEWYKQRQISQQLLQRKLQTELQLLKAQLQPTFLFDTLRMLHTLTSQKSASSPAAVLHLSALLRYLLYDSQQAMVPLASEVEMMRHYVALEQLRLGNQVEVSLNFSGALEAHRIAPLLLLPFVENAFRRGSDAHAECSWVSLDLVVKQNSLTFKVINSQTDTESDTSPDLGLNSIRQRLQLLYPHQHELKVVSEPDTLLLVLHLQLARALPLELTELARAPYPLTTTL